MIVVVNEKQVEVDEQTTVAGLLKSLGFPDRGIAVAMDFSVLPRSGLDDKAFRRCTTRGGDGGARWLIPN